MNLRITWYEEVFWIWLALGYFQWWDFVDTEITWYEEVFWIWLALGYFQWWDFGDTVMNLQIP
jgi:hypothetical protein